jgi:hypothetical protein
MTNSKLVTLNHTLHHHVGGVNAIALNPDGDRVISSGKVKFLNPFVHLFMLVQVMTVTSLYGMLRQERRFKSFLVCFMVLSDHSFGLPKGLSFHPASPLVVPMAVSTYISVLNRRYVMTL